jgi:hypothetical protein
MESSIMLDRLALKRKAHKPYRRKLKKANEPKALFAGSVPVKYNEIEHTNISDCYYKNINIAP